jgi:transposase
MNTLSIRHFFPFSKLKLEFQRVNQDNQVIEIETRADKRYRPVCSGCGLPAGGSHSYFSRSIRDLNIAGYVVYLPTTFRKLRCPKCGIRVEDLGFVGLWQPITKRLAEYIVYLCSIMTISDVSRHLGLDWRLVKRIDKMYLSEAYTHVHSEELHILAIDEIAIRKGHRYLTVVINYETGEVVWMSEGRSRESLEQFFESLPPWRRAGISAVALDMWQPYISVIEQYCPQAKLVFDFYHMVASFNRVIDKVRNQEYKKASHEEKDVIKGSKYLLLKNNENLKETQKPKLKRLLEMNQKLFEVYLLKDEMKRIWQTDDREEASQILDAWCQAAYETELVPVIHFAETLKIHREGILNHCEFPIHTSKLEGINNKIKVIKRKAYGYHDLDYFIIKVKSIFSGRMPQWCN